MHVTALYGDLEMMAPAVLAWFASAWNSCAQTAATTLVTSIWQGLVLVCGLEICMRPRISAAHRFAVWAAGFVVAAGLPLLPLLHFGANPAGADAANAGVRGNTAGALLELDARWGLAIAGLWVVASAIRGASL